jgi:hypothetical protein
MCLRSTKILFNLSPRSRLRSFITSQPRPAAWPKVLGVSNMQMITPFLFCSLIFSIFKTYHNLRYGCASLLISSRSRPVFKIVEIIFVSKHQIFPLSVSGLENTIIKGRHDLTPQFLIMIVKMDKMLLSPSCLSIQLTSSFISLLEHFQLVHSFQHSFS